jgi:hypothetical protein
MFDDSELDEVGRELKQIDRQSLPGTFSLSEAQADFAPENFWSPILDTPPISYRSDNTWFKHPFPFEFFTRIFGYLTGANKVHGTLSVRRRTRIISDGRQLAKSVDKPFIPLPSSIYPTSEPPL